MNTHTVRSLLLGAVALSVGLLVKAAPELDLAPTTTGFADESAAARPVAIDRHAVSPAGPEAGPLVNGRRLPAFHVASPGLTVHLAVSDPLVVAPAFSYAALVRFGDLPALAYNPVLFGRWQTQPSARSLAAVFIGADARLQFLASEDGSAEASLGGASEKPLPAGEWIVVAMSWKPNMLSYGIYTLGGVPLQEASWAAPRAPKALYSDDQPLRISAPKEFGLMLARFQAHGAYLAPAEAARALLTGE